MNEDNSIIIALKEAVRKAISEAANEEIKRQIHRFECKMGVVKSQMVGKLVEQIDIATTHEPLSDKYIVQVIIHPNRGAKMEQECE